MKKNIYFAVASLLLLAGCTTLEEPVMSVKNEIQVKVYNVKTWNAQSDKMDTLVGATVYLISDAGTVTVITNSKGVATFSDVREKTYSITCSKDNLSNMLNKETVNSKEIGNLIIGVYKSQEDINNSAMNSNAVVGGAKLYDANYDNRIASDDKILGQPVNFKENYKDINADGNLDAKDFVNGSLVKIDSQMEVTVFVGN